MLTRRLLFAIIACAFSANSAMAAARIRTANFEVEAPDENIARQFGQMAEHYRRQKAIEWLGQEMPQWPSPCPLFVKPTMGGAGGATSFNYDRGSYRIISMTIEGTIERMLNSVLPHEVTHTVFAHHFRSPVPRWADEGGSVISEDDSERAKHDQLCRNYLNAGRMPTMRRLFGVREYHEVSDVMHLYAGGFSISNYLVERSDRQTFLNFVAIGMQQGWDRAAQTYYNLQSVEQLEEAWLQHLRETKGQARNRGGNTAATFAAAPAGRPNATSMSREVVRLTAPPAQPMLDPAGPVYRGQSDDRWSPPRQPQTPPPGVKPLGPNQPRTRPSLPAPPVTLGVPEYAPTPQSPRPIQPQGPSPVGFQN